MFDFISIILGHKGYNKIHFNTAFFFSKRSQMLFFFSVFNALI